MAAPVRLLSCLTTFANTWLGTSWRLPSTWGIVYGIIAFFTGLNVTVFRSMVTVVCLPHAVWLFVASKVVSEEVFNMGSGEILLEILRKIPILRDIPFIQHAAARGVTRVNQTVDRIIYLRDRVTGEVCCRVQAASDGIHYHIDSYVDLPRDVLLVLLRDYLVNGPIEKAKQWVEDHLEVPDMLQEAAGEALHDMTARVCRRRSLYSEVSRRGGRSHRVRSVAEPVTAQQQHSPTIRDVR